MSEQHVIEHYTQGRLLSQIDAALTAMGHDPALAGPDQLRAVDEFHIGGPEATDELAERLDLRPGLRVLDLGSGLGGPTRYLARSFGVAVTGVDVTDEYLDVARALTRRTGLDTQVRFDRASATALPYADRSFDRAWMLHVGMNIPDKLAVFTEARRVLTDDAVFAVYDVMALGPTEQLRFPQPWAQDPANSHLATAALYREQLAAAGFRVVGEDSRLERSIENLRATRRPAAQPPTRSRVASPAMGADAPLKVANALLGMEHGIIAPTRLVCTPA